MNPSLVITILLSYFALLVTISWFTSRKADADSYFLGNKKSPWLAVAFGMLGDSLSGVTFISVPGAVYTGNFAYLQLVFGYFAGYFVISEILLPLYYRLNVTSIYSYLGIRIGSYSERTGSVYFLLSRLLGAGGRLYLAAGVIHLFVLQQLNIPFAVSVAVIILLMLVYTLKGGIKTLVWTDVLQSAVLLLAVNLSILAIMHSTGKGIGEMISGIWSDPHTETFFWDWKLKSFFPKMFIGGMLTAIAMTGLDQNMMQKNLSCKSLGEAQKNIRTFSFVMMIVNIFFLALGVLLYQYYTTAEITLPLAANGDVLTDKVFPKLAMEHLGMFPGIVFILGLTAATFSSADSVLTTLTTSFYIDILRMDKNTAKSEASKHRIRNIIHISFAFTLLIVILIFDAMNNDAIINTILTIAGYTYGPLLGLFAFGIYTTRIAKDNWVPVICILAPLLSWLLSTYSKTILGGYEFGYELLGVNGLLVFAGLMLVSKPKSTTAIV
ncbi:MAG TPA: sodium:solute symporter [Flavobacteriales bacterium]|nr:sodium:solute symporter [Flavobacteriales bacterium]HRE96089.1 sodium:solute symporter [Flavobacteriales bacterium]HRJ37443.1 sodium:solute symporter [Flavobacteriales bacterium]